MVAVMTICREHGTHQAHDRDRREVTMRIKTQARTGTAAALPQRRSKSPVTAEPPLYGGSRFKESGSLLSAQISLCAVNNKVLWGRNIKA